MSGDPLSADVLKSLWGHAETGYPEEICGFLVEGPGGITVRPAENRQNALHAEDPEHFPRDARTAYNLGPKDLFYLDRHLSGDERVTAIYHSHCDVGAYFSDEDQRAALFDGEPLYTVDYVVIDVRADGARQAKRFRWDGQTFAEVASYERR